MKKLLIGAIVSVLSLPALAQDTSWANTQIKSGETHIAHMAHTTTVLAKGTGLRETHATMRLICTPQDKAVIGVKWNTFPELNNVTVQVDVDGRNFRKSHTWNTDGTFMYRRIEDSTKLIDAMKRGKSVTLRFTHEGRTWEASYPLNGFTNASKVFTDSCK